jgi:dTDP-glucose pyrophosphorylase
MQAVILAGGRGTRLAEETPPAARAARQAAALAHHEVVFALWCK